MGLYLSFIIINTAVFLQMVGVGMIVARLPQRIMDLSGSVASVGYLASAFALFYVTFQIPIGMLADRYGIKRFLVGGYLLCSLVGLLYYFSGSANMIFLGRMLQGVGEIPMWALAPALLTLQAPSGKGKSLGIYNASLHCGLTAGSLLGMSLCAAWQDETCFLMFSVAGLAAALLTVFLVDVSPYRTYTEKKILSRRYLYAVMNNSTNQRVLAGIVLYGAGYGVFITLIPAFLISVKNGDNVTVGLFFTFFYVVLGGSQLIAGPLSDRNGRKGIMLCGLMMAGGGIAVAPFLEQPWLLGPLTVAAFGLGVFCVAAMAFLNESAPASAKGTISAVFCFFWGAGYFLGPLFLGCVISAFEFKTGFLSLAGIIGLELIALAYGFRTTTACGDSLI